MDTKCIYGLDFIFSFIDSMQCVSGSGENTTSLSSGSKLNPALTFLFLASRESPVSLLFASTELLALALLPSADVLFRSLRAATAGRKGRTPALWALQRQLLLVQFLLFLMWLLPLRRLLMLQLLLCVFCGSCCCCPWCGCSWKGCFVLSGCFFCGYS